MSGRREPVRRVRGIRVGAAAATIAAILGATVAYAAVPADAAAAALTVTISRATIPCAPTMWLAPPVDGGASALQLPLTVLWNTYRPRTEEGSLTLLVSGRIDGAVPGQRYFDYPLFIPLPDWPSFSGVDGGDLGVADASGTVQFTDVGTSHGLVSEVGINDEYQITDSPMIFPGTGTTALATGSTPVTLNTTCANLAYSSARRSMRTNNNISLNQQSDGNLVMRIGSRAVWSIGTAGHPGAKTMLQGDGNVVLRAPNGRALWNSGTAGHPGAFAILQTDGNLVIRTWLAFQSAQPRPLWSTGVHH